MNALRNLAKNETEIIFILNFVLILIVLIGIYGNNLSYVSKIYCLKFIAINKR